MASTSPANGAIGVALDATISATASEALNPATLNATTFTLTAVGGGAVVPGSITFSGTTATFTPSAVLTVNTQYIATITSGVKDLAGNAMTANYVWSFTTITVPGAPVIGPATAGNAQATVTFAPPANSGGAPVTNYTVTSNPGGITATGAASPIVVPGLINGTPYTFTVTADNMAGTGPASAPSNSVTPAVGAAVPGAPTIGAATAGNAQATVAFTPGAAGSSATLSYTVTSSPGGFSASGAASPVTVPGLANGTAYTFTVTAFNSAGPSPASGASNSVTPATAPSAPLGVVASAGSLQAVVSFGSPASTGGVPITGYTVTSNPGGGVDANAGTTGLSHLVTGLVNGTPYTFTVTATNAGVQPAGVPLTGPPSAPSNNVTPNVAVVAPPAPTGVNAVASSSGPPQATVNFTPPVCSLPACPAVSSYTVTSNPSGITASGAASPIVVPGLIAGTAYTFTVTATNSVGTGPAGGPSNSVTPKTAPGAPTAVTAAAGTSQVTVSFTAPVNTGGSPIIGYTATANPGGVFVSQTGPATPITVTGLTNGIAYTFTVTAFNAVGTGSPSLPSNSATPIPAATIPGAPTIGTATAGNAQATVTFSAPASDGNSPITKYTATSSPGGFTGTVLGAAAAPITVTGLTNGQAYTFTVTATNGVGPSLASAASNAIVPATVPGAPTINSATAGNAQATLGFTPPASNGGSAITLYTVTSSPGGITAFGAASPIVVNGLTNGPPGYTFTVTATNAVGTGPGAVSGTVIPNLTTTVPPAPTAVSAVASTSGAAQAVVSFTPPTCSLPNCPAISSYTVTALIGGVPTAITASGGASPITVTGLTIGTAYTFTVAATNSVGTGPTSGASNSVTPTTVPGAPTIGTATSGNAQATVSFTAPVNTGGSAITGYTVTALIGGVPTAITASGGASPLTVNGLTNGQAYTFTATATNSTGTSAPSAQSNSVTPNVATTVPPAPTAVSAVASTSGAAQAVVSFTPPTCSLPGCPAISSYTVTALIGGVPTAITASGGASPITVTGLTIGTAYTFTVTAANSVGTGPTSGASNSVTPTTVPGAPTIGTATATGASGQVTVAFTPPVNTGGSLITGYVVTALIGGVPQAITASGSASAITVNGLTNGQAYTFTVTASNSTGTSAPSAQSNSVAPLMATVPSAPTGASAAVSGVGQAIITFTPGANGGSPITSFTVASNPGGASASGASSPITVTGLTLGQPYTFTVKATNAIGISLASAPSNSVTSLSTPGAPTIGVANAGPGSGQATVAFTPPASNGGTAITSYTATSSPGNFTGTGTTSPITVSGLTNGQPYTFTVIATNSQGPSLPSAASNSATPSAVAPTCPVAGPPALSVVAGRTTGVAPLAVFFDASGTTSSAVTSRPFHEIQYQWNFGDPGAGNWFPAPQGGAAVALLSRSGGLATAVTSAAHGFNTGDRIRITGALPQAYNTEAIVTVVNATTFTYPVPVTATSPATGTIRATGMNGIARNTGLGPVVAHVFDPAPGSGTQNYNVTLTAFDGTNTSSCSVQITVTDPNAVFSGTNTTCVSASGNFTGCPSGANQVTTASFDTGMANAGAGKRVLFNRANVFSTASGFNVKGVGPALVGAYGTGALPIVNMGANNSGALGIFGGNTSDWRFVDLWLDSNGHSSTSCFGATDTSFTKAQITLLRLTCNGSSTAAQIETGFGLDAPAASQPNQIAVVDSTFNYVNGEAIFVWAGQYAELGNYFNGGCCETANGSGIQNQSRHMGVSKGVISYNTWANLFSPGPSYGSALTIRTHTLPATDPQPGKTVVANNAIDLGNNVFAVSVFASIPGDLQIKDIIVDGNYITVNSPNGSPQGVGLSGVDTATVRNNLITIGGTATFAPTAVVLQIGTGGESALNNVIYNNSIFSSHTAAGNLIFLNGFNSGVKSPVIRNNAGFAPNQSSVSMIADGGAVTPTFSNNSSDAQVHGTAPAGWANPPVTVLDWKPTSGCGASCYLVGGGFVGPPPVPVFSDIFLVPRTGPPYDIGAVVH